MKYPWIFLLVLIGFMETKGQAVDGYKDIKFDISFNDLKIMNKCSLGEPTQTKGVTIYDCHGLTVGSQKAATSFYFINDKLKRVSLCFIGTEVTFKDTLNALNGKYGKYSELKDDSAWNKTVVTYDYSWTKENVSFSAIRTESKSPGYEYHLCAAYSVPNYQDLKRKQESEYLRNDL